MATRGQMGILSQLPLLRETFCIPLLSKVSVGCVRNTGLKERNWDIDARPLNIRELFKKYSVRGTSNLQIAVIQETPA